MRDGVGSVRALVADKRYGRGVFRGMSVAGSGEFVDLFANGCYFVGGGGESVDCGAGALSQIIPRAVAERGAVGIWGSNDGYSIARKGDLSADGVWIASCGRVGGCVDEI